MEEGGWLVVQIMMRCAGVLLKNRHNLASTHDPKKMLIEIP